MIWAYYTEIKWQNNMFIRILHLDDGYTLGLPNPLLLCYQPMSKAYTHGTDYYESSTNHVEGFNSWKFF